MSVRWIDRAAVGRTGFIHTVKTSHRYAGDREATEAPRGAPGPGGGARSHRLSPRATRRAIRPPAATGPESGPAALRDLLLRNPSLLEEGLRVLETDLDAAPFGRIDFFGADARGAPVLVLLSDGDSDAALVRLLDQSAWVRTRLVLFARAFPGAGLVPGLPARGFLVAPAFSPAFFDRLPLLGMEVVPCIARGAASLPPGAVFLERAAALLEAGAVTTAWRTPEPAAWPAADPTAWPATEVPPDPPAEAARGAAAAPPADTAVAGGDGEAEVLPPLDPVFDADAVPVLPPEPPIGFAGEIRPAEPFETLTAEELEEFDRFEQIRRGGDGRSS